MVGFLLGHEFDRDGVRDRGRSVLVLAVVSRVATAAVVAGGLLVLGTDARAALALAGVAASTAPAATVPVVRDVGARGRLTRTLLAFVAVADALAIVLFTVLWSVGVLVAGDGAPTALAVQSGREIGGARGGGRLPRGTADPPRPRG